MHRPLGERDYSGEAAIATGANPRDRKVQLAKAIVALYHDQGAADAAEQRFNNVFASGAMPDDAPTVSVAKGAVLADVLVAEKLFLQSPIGVAS